LIHCLKFEKFLFLLKWKKIIFSLVKILKKVLMTSFFCSGRLFKKKLKKSFLILKAQFPFKRQKLNQMSEFRVVHVSGVDPINSWPKVLDFLKYLKTQNLFPIALISVNSVCDQLLKVCLNFIHKYFFDDF